MIKAALASIFTILAISTGIPPSGGADAPGNAAVAPHRFNAEDQKIIDTLAEMSGRKVDDVVRLYKTGKGWGDVAENLGLDMEDVLKEVMRAEKADTSKGK